ncbi:MAG: homocysteine S-methyltransferase [Caldilinea sp. CFX5]|nr:homocysteine S-methyltransferase [Caldilinea sp. CFX5]
MTKYRNQLPQLTGDLFLSDGGIETTLIFHNGLDLPLFAAFPLLHHDEGVAALRSYFETYAGLARKYNTGFILESATWRASADWGQKLGYAAADLAHLNRKAITLLEEVREQYETVQTPMVISGCIGPRGDGYNPAFRMTVVEAEQFHTAQVQTFRHTAADMISAITMNYPEEAIGITRAAQAAAMPVVIALTVETDGRLPTGHTLAEAIAQIDEATTGGPLYYMINCAHPTHFEDKLTADQDWSRRIRGLRANASTKSHAELDESTELDAGNPVELGQQYRSLRRKLPLLNVLGGCCGTDHRHIEEICKSWLL